MKAIKHETKGKFSCKMTSMSLEMTEFKLSQKKGTTRNNRSKTKFYRKTRSDARINRPLRAVLSRARPRGSRRNLEINRTKIPDKMADWASR